MKLSLFLFLVAVTTKNVLSSFPHISLQPTTSLFPPEEMEALHFLYISTGGDSWQWKDEVLYGPRWNFSNDLASTWTNPCNTNGSTWQGITCNFSPSYCSYEICHVQKIELRKYALQGQLPDCIGNISMLQFLGLESNLLTGTIPAGLGGLSSLKSLYLSANKLSGEINSSIFSEMQSLERLEMDGNLLTGSVPATLGCLTNLERLLISFNKFTGQLPDSLSSLSNIEVIDVSSNKLTGSIPSWLSNFHGLKRLYFSINLFSHTIPEFLGNLNELERIFLFLNQLTGTLPTSIGNLSMLERLDVGFNDLTGPLGNEMGNLTSMELLDLDSNQFSGSVPCSIANISTLKRIDLAYNTVSGPLCTKFGYLSSLIWLYFDHNKFTGTIPAEYGSLSLAQRLHFDTNYLTGTIPPVFGNISHLEWLTFHNNFLSGSIPDDFDRFIELETINFENNQFTATIPSSIGKVESLKRAYFNSNLLSGTLPANFGDLSNIEHLLIDVNGISGTIPQNYGDLQSIKYFDFSFNTLSGSVPDSFGKLKSLELLYLGSNSLRGSIPDALSNMTSLEELSLELNDLAGSIPKQLGQLAALKKLFLDSNRLTNQIPAELGNLKNLKQLDLGNNRLTGDIPGSIGLPRLVMISLSVNCLRSVIPIDFCNMEAVEVISLNGLDGAENCHRGITLPIFDTKILYSLDSTIPDCLWSLPKLSTLHLTGNGFGGGISSLASTSGIEDLSLSHNHLEGTIPALTNPLLSLDVSYNRLSGLLNTVSAFTNASTIIAKVNRLSGNLPVGVLSEAFHLNVLHGNMFSCDTIPENDVDSYGYACGSVLYDYSMYFMAAVTVSVACFILYFLSRNKWCFFYVGFLSSSFGTSEDKSVKTILLWVKHLLFHQKFFIVLFLVVMAGSFPIFILRYSDTDAQYSTHQNVYSWVLSLVYMKGELMGLLGVVLWMSSTFAFFCFIWLAIQKEDKGFLNISNALSGSLPYLDYCRTYAAYFCNFIVTVGVNMLYIYCIYELEFSRAAVFAIRFCMSIFRIVSSATVLPMLSRIVKDPVQMVVFRFRLLLFNNLLIPCIVTALTSPNCFQEILLKPNPISTSYYHEECELFLFGPVEETCLRYTVIERETASFVPAFSYNYQCTPILLDAYVPVLIIGFCIQLLLPFFFTTILLKYIDYASLPSFTRPIFHGLLWPEYWHNNDSNQSSNVMNANPFHIFNFPSVICFDMLSPLSILFTFGLCSPSLAFIIFLFSVVKMQFWIWAVNRFCLHNCGNCEACMSHEIDIKMIFILSRSVLPLRGIIMAGFDMIVICSAVFMISIYWDTTGSGSWIMLGPLLFALVLILVMKAMHDKEQLKTDTTKDIELKETNMNPIVETSESEKF